MAKYNGFDKLNTPMYICSPELEVVYRNRAGKRLSPSPRLHSNAKRIFVNEAEAVVPGENEIKYICCRLNDSIKTALCFNYHGDMMLIFSAMFDYDLLYNEFVKNIDGSFTKQICGILDYVSEYDANSASEHFDKFGLIEKLRSYIFAGFDNCLALSLFSTRERFGIPMFKFFNYFNKKILPSINKSGYRVETDYSELTDVWENFYVDAANFSVVFADLLLFCLEISKDKKCIIKTEYLGTVVRSKMVFSYDGSLVGQGSDLSKFGKSDPVAYLNVMPYEELCKCLSWKIGYKISGEKALNSCIYFDVENDTDAIFNSGVGMEEIEKSFEKLMENIMNLFIR